MTTTAAVPSAAVAFPRRRSHLDRTYPGWWLYVGAAIGWVGLAVVHLASLLVPAAPSTTHHVHHAAAAEGAAGEHVGPWLLTWTLMVVAMMWPLWAPSAARVAQASARRWRWATVSTQVLTITLLWIAAGVAVAGIAAVLAPGVPGEAWAVAWLLVALGLTRSRRRARALRTCGRNLVVAPWGRRALWTAARAGGRDWPRCALLCGPVMAAMVTEHSFGVVVAGSAAVWWEQLHPRAWADPVPVVFLLAAVVLALA